MIVNLANSRTLRQQNGWAFRVASLLLTLVYGKLFYFSSFPSLYASDFWAIEDRENRAKLPEFITIPAARAEELTPSQNWPTAAEYHTWQRSLGDPSNSRYSLLDQINRNNVHLLKPAWTYHSGDGPGNLQCNPIIVGKYLIGPSSGDSIVALDVSNGREIWRFRDWGPVSLGTRPAYRGLNYWPGTPQHPERILFTANQRLYALDPKSGRPLISFGQNGSIPVPASTSVAGIFQNLLILPGFHRDVFAWDLITGERVWTFQTIPQGDEFGANTWDQPTEGANAWGGLALDVPRGIVYIATGSPKPNFTGASHRGRNLFANCVLALNALTGERLWHFQEIRHDIWDLDLPAPPNLVTVRRGNQMVDAVAQVTKLGNTLLLDRLTGKPLFPFHLRRAPTSNLPGEITWPYQPDVRIPEPFARQIFTLDDVTDLSPEATESVMKQIQNSDFGWFQPFNNGRPLVFYGIHGGAEWTGACFDPSTGYLYVSSNEIPWQITVASVDQAPVDESQRPLTPGRESYLRYCVACHGPNREGVGSNPSLQSLGTRFPKETLSALLRQGRNLMPAFSSLSPEEIEALKNYLFVETEALQKVSSDRLDRPRYQSFGYPKLLDHEGYPGSKPPWGTLNCIDLNSGRLIWQVPLGEYPELSRRGHAKTGTENFGGPIVTQGGLVFCGGTRDQKIRAFDKLTGEELWSHPLPYGGYAPPATYEWEGRQYVVIPATGGGKLGGPVGDCYQAFALPQDTPQP